MERIKPFGYKNYGSIPHLSGSRLGERDYVANPGHEPDPIHFSFVKLSLTGEVSPMVPEDWVQPFLEHGLLNTVPNDVRSLFEVARGAMIYGYFFYPLWTLGIEQQYRVVEAAVSHKCNALGAPKSKRRFVDKIDWLEAAGAISVADKEMLSEIRELRNRSSHPARQSIMPPGVAISLLDAMEKVINSLFDVKGE